MSQSTLILGLSLAYLGLLFVVAHFGERGAARWSRSRAGPIIYALSLSIYCTSWTFYGAVGRAATAKRKPERPDQLAQTSAEVSSPASTPA